VGYKDAFFDAGPADNGVYEPTVVVDHGVRHTSLAANPDIGLQWGAQYYRTCYSALAPPVRPGGEPSCTTLLALDSSASSWSHS